MSIAAINRMRAAHGLPPIPVAEKARKYRNQPCEYDSPLVGRMTYPSKRQMRRAMDLDALYMAGEIRWWLPEIPLRLKAYTDARQRIMRVDFLICWADGQVTWEDAKGVKPTAAWTLKRDIVKEQYGIEIEIV